MFLKSASYPIHQNYCQLIFSEQIKCNCYNTAREGFSRKGKKNEYWYVRKQVKKHQTTFFIAQ